MDGRSDSSASDLESTPAIHQARSRVGAVLRGKWKIDRLVGIGWMGAVYAATHRNGRRAAIKVLLPLHGADRNTVKRFLKEGYVANELAHPGAVEIFDDDYTEDGLPFLVMELLHGQSLASKLAEPHGRLTVDEAVRIGSEVLGVLAAAHERGIIHRDVKPDNVFLLHDGRVKLLDFGVARLRTVTSAGHTTASGALLGTPTYMAPEQARGKNEAIDARTDLFGVGAMLYAALSGRDVREATTLNELLLLAMTEPAKPLREVAPGLPEQTAYVVDRALAFAREDRWPSALAMREALLGNATGFMSTEPRVAIAVGGGEVTLDLAVGVRAPVLATPARAPGRSRAMKTIGVLGALGAVVVLGAGAGALAVSKKGLSAVTTNQPSGTAMSEPAAVTFAATAATTAAASVPLAPSSASAPPGDAVARALPAPSALPAASAPLSLTSARRRPPVDAPRAIPIASSAPAATPPAPAPAPTDHEVPVHDPLNRRH